MQDTVSLTLSLLHRHKDAVLFTVLCFEPGGEPSFTNGRQHTSSVISR